MHPLAGAAVDNVRAQQLIDHELHANRLPYADYRVLAGVIAEDRVRFVAAQVLPPMLDPRAPLAAGGVVVGAGERARALVGGGVECSHGFIGHGPCILIHRPGYPPPGHAAADGFTWRTS